MIDWPLALTMTGGDESLLAEVIEVFQEEAPSLMAGMRDALANGDRTLLHRAAHTMKNSLLSLGATQASETAFELEKLARDGHLEDAAALYAALESDLPRVSEELNRRFKIRPLP